MKLVDEQTIRNLEMLLRQTEQERRDLLAWIDARIEAEVTHRPDVNIYKKTLEGTWRQIRNRVELMPDVAVPAGARLAEEQRALERCYQRLKNDARIGQHMSDCGCGTCADVAAVERARGGQ